MEVSPGRAAGLFSPDWSRWGIWVIGVDPRSGPGVPAAILALGFSATARADIQLMEVARRPFYFFKKPPPVTTLPSADIFTVGCTNPVPIGRWVTARCVGRTGRPCLPLPPVVESGTKITSFTGSPIAGGKTTFSTSDTGFRDSSKVGRSSLLVRVATTVWSARWHRPCPPAPNGAVHAAEGRFIHEEVVVRNWAFPAAATVPI